MELSHANCAWLLLFLALVDCGARGWFVGRCCWMLQLLSRHLRAHKPTDGFTFGLCVHRSVGCLVWFGFLRLWGPFVHCGGGVGGGGVALKHTFRFGPMCCPSPVQAFYT